MLILSCGKRAVVSRTLFTVVHSNFALSHQILYQRENKLTQYFQFSTSYNQVVNSFTVLFKPFISLKGRGAIHLVKAYTFSSNSSARPCIPPPQKHEPEFSKVLNECFKNRILYLAPPHGMLYFTMYTGVAIILAVSITFTLNISLLPEASDFLKLACLATFSVGLFSVWNITSVPRKLVRKITLIGNNTQTGRINIITRKWFPLLPAKTFLVEPHKIRVSNLFNSSSNGITTDKSLLFSINKLLTHNNSPKIPPTSQNFFKWLNSPGVLREYRFLTQPSNIPRLYIGNEYVYIDPRGKMMDGGAGKL